MPTGQAEDAAAFLNRLRSEHAAQEDQALQALLLHECGVLEEKHGEEPSAARDYLAAFNADPQFREPLESLVRILTRRKSIKNLGKLLEALTRASVTPEERARAFWERAAFLQDYEQNLPGAKEALEEAVGASPEDPTPWLELELIAAKDGDLPGRMRAIEARAELASDPTWKAYLFIELAELSAKAGDAQRAYDLIDAAAALDGQGQFRSQVTLEAISAREDNPTALARALEGQAQLIEEALEDEARGDASGVPRFARRAEYAADAWLRAAELKRRAGDQEGWVKLLARAAEQLPQSSVIARSRLASLEANGDAKGAADLARAELARGAPGPAAAALWLRIAEAAMLDNDRDGALEALRSALEADPASIMARALELDLLSDAQDPAALARSLEASGASCSTSEAKARAEIIAAYVWACQAGDSDAAKAALGRAAALGTPAPLLARIARTLASVRGDAAWYEQVTAELVANGAEQGEDASLWFELGRSRALRGDADGAAEAFAKLATLDGDASTWLGRVLAAYALGAKKAAPGEVIAVRPLASTIEELAKVETDPTLARGLWVVAALRSTRSGNTDQARARLRELHEAAPSDEVVALFLAELERRAGDLASASTILSTCATMTEDIELGAALYLEAALLTWRIGDRQKTIELIEQARGSASKAAAALLAWALRGADPDSLDGRRRALLTAAEAGADPASIAIERFGLEVGQGEAGDRAEALTALETAEAEGSGDITVAAGLARLTWPDAQSDRAAIDRALDRLEDQGDEATAIARAEAYRLARVVDQDPGAAVSRAAAWADAEPKLYAALEWLGASLTAKDREAEVAARRAVGSFLDDEPWSAMEASAALVAMLDQPSTPQPLLAGTSDATRLANLELAMPGCDPRRRAFALQNVGGALGEEAGSDASALSGWSELAAGNVEAALATFRASVERRQDDIVSWEGVRAASEALGDHVSTALALAQLGALSKDDTRGAAFWESAGIILLDHTDAHDDAEIAFARAFDRDPSRSVAFDKLFRRVRSRNEDDKLLDIIGRRLDVADDEAEIGKLFWERARVLRKKGDREGALSALENVTMLEPDHVGALALAGEISITMGKFAEAADLLGRLSGIGEAPAQQRLMSGVAAVDIYENKLNAPEKALKVLVGLHEAGLSTPPVRERLARVAAKTGAWSRATSILEQLMQEREKREGRMEAARLSMAIWRDKINEPLKAEASVVKLLDESPDDGEALDLVLTTSYDASLRQRLLGRAKSVLVQKLSEDPCDADRVERLAKIAQAGQDAALRQATLGCLVSLGRDDDAISTELKRIDGRVATRPQIVLDAKAMAEIADPEDNGPIAELFVLMAETVTLALGPTLGSMNVGKKERIDSRGGHPLRVAVAEWMGAVGFEGDFELYVGGPEPKGVHGVAGEVPAIVIGSGITAPLDAAARSAIARTVFALRRGITSLRTRDEATVASVVIAACNEVDIKVANPGYAVYGEIQRAVHKEISRKIRKSIGDVCQKVVASKQDARAWTNAARRSLDRMAVIAAGDVSIVLSDTLNVPRDQLGSVVTENERSRRLLSFVLSPSYLELRKKLGMGVR
ncbi:tetratricopeptide repeat protein [Polyangium fumosum]|uniref:tetratricopeptide repeat protein n=1 Tax=Polyangium fumosum TaxID=889272 RepID=UPI0014792E79|nr:tetratricopeptide repeat protein [Polyangium fumosum]